MLTRPLLLQLHILRLRPSCQQANQPIRLHLLRFLLLSYNPLNLVR
jgi:hypothetical protein